MAIKKELLGDNPCYLYFEFFTFSFSGLDACYYCRNIIVSLFSSFVPSFSLPQQESSKVVTCCPETDSVCLTKNSPKITRSSFRSEFVCQHALYNCIYGICSEFFDLSCRSVPKKLFTTCWSIFPRFCRVLHYHCFANLKLGFPLKKPFWQS